jgi:hypothetical protein
MEFSEKAIDLKQKIQRIEGQKSWKWRREVPVIDLHAKMHLNQI